MRAWQHEGALRAASTPLMKQYTVRPCLTQVGSLMTARPQLVVAIMPNWQQPMQAQAAWRLQWGRGIKGGHSGQT